MPRTITIIEPYQGSGDICFRSGDAILSILYLIPASGASILRSREATATLTDIIGDRSPRVPNRFGYTIGHKFNGRV